MFFTLLKLSKTYRFREKFVDIIGTILNSVKNPHLSDDFFGLQNGQTALHPALEFPMLKDIAFCQRGRKDLPVGHLVTIFRSMILIYGCVRIFLNQIDLR